jgi:hypothetical protein
VNAQPVDALIMCRETRGGNLVVEGLTGERVEMIGIGEEVAVVAGVRLPTLLAAPRPLCEAQPDSTSNAHTRSGARTVIMHVPLLLYHIVI